MVNGTPSEVEDLTRRFPTSINYVHKFAFNHQMLKEFVQIQYAPFRVPVIYGFVQIQSIDTSTAFILISRKDARRMGRRFVVRGLNREGNAANFVETEHVLTLRKANGTFVIASHLQTRGSIPMLWTMKPTLAWAPPVVVGSNFDESFQAAQRHVKETQADYSKQYWVNLIDKKGSQDRIGKKMTMMHQSLKNPDIEYTWFDFHGECKKMKWENLSKLVNIVKEKMLGYGYFMAEMQVGFGQRELINNTTCKIQQSQIGVMRTNCMDCLDRTNVVQSVFSRQIAHIQLANMGVGQQPRGQPFEVFQYKQLEQAFRNVWTDNADAMSMLYTGTPALKTDFTRTGKRSYMGAFNDGKNSMTRYFINNFQDGYNVDCLDLSQGNLTPQQKMNTRSALSPIRIALISLVGFMFLARFLLKESFPHPEEANGAENSENSIKIFVLHSLVYFGVLMVGILGIQYNGKAFVDDCSRMDV